MLQQESDRLQVEPIPTSVGSPPISDITSKVTPPDPISISHEFTQLPKFNIRTVPLVEMHYSGSPFGTPLKPQFTITVLSKECRN